MVPRVSVVLPVYNGEDYIEAAIQSVLDQTFTDFECVIIDDGSKDATGAILRAAQKRDPRIRVISRENRGIVPSLNEGLEAARADLIARFDGDDLMVADRLERQVAFLDAHPDHVLVGGQILLIDPKGRPLTEIPLPLDDTTIVKSMLGGTTALAHPAVMFRRAKALEIDGYSEVYVVGEDVDFFLRLSEVGKCANLPQRVLLYRLHAKSISHQSAQAQADFGDQAVRAAAVRRGLPEPPAGGPARADDEVQMERRWGWWALQSKEIGTARHYARRVLARRPFAKESWRLMYCALRGH